MNLLIISNKTTQYELCIPISSIVSIQYLLNHLDIFLKDATKLSLVISNPLPSEPHLTKEQRDTAIKRLLSVYESIKQAIIDENPITEIDVNSPIVFAILPSIQLSLEKIENSINRMAN